MGNATENNSQWNSMDQNLSQNNMAHFDPMYESEKN